MFKIDQLNNVIKPHVYFFVLDTQAILHLLVVMCRSCLLTDCLLGQALNEAVLPSTKHPKIFLAQGFDAQDPTGDQNWPT